MRRLAIILFVLGLGIGLVMQIAVLVYEPASDLSSRPMIAFACLSALMMTAGAVAWIYVRRTDAKN
jgi:hypothetical protein